MTEDPSHTAYSPRYGAIILLSDDRGGLMAGAALFREKFPFTVDESYVLHQQGLHQSCELEEEPEARVSHQLRNISESTLALCDCFGPQPQAQGDYARAAGLVKMLRSMLMQQL